MLSHGIFFLRASPITHEASYSVSQNSRVLFKMPKRNAKNQKQSVLGMTVVVKIKTDIYGALFSYKAVDKVATQLTVNDCFSDK